MTRPLTLSERVARAQARQEREGWRRLTLRLPPDAAQALDRLLSESYAETATAVITRALLTAVRR